MSLPVQRPSQFAQHAANSFQQTFGTLFEQSNVECQRLNRVNAVLAQLEDDLLNPEVLDALDDRQRIALMELLLESKSQSLKSLLEFGRVYKDIRNIVGMMDSLQQYTSSPEQRAALANRVDDDDEITDADFDEV